jgi:hypoxanthine phosphoribosyltransferase
MKKDVERILIKKSDLQRRVRELAEEINRDYKGKDLVLVGVLRGAVFFLTDLARNINLPLTIDFIAISRYKPGEKGVVRLVKDLEESIEGKDVLVVEDIVDTGLTLAYLCRNLEARNPASLEVCTLLNRPARRIAKISLKYVGFDIPDVFVIGYGLDYEEKFRNLSCIAIPKEKVYLG